jgi:hypothetical protein
MNADISTSGLLAALALASLLGFRHGFDADHIAVVDGMTRARQLHRSYWASRAVGLQFAAGHAATILVAALLLFGQGAALPAWLDGLGVAVSSVLLLVIAATNLAHALSPRSERVRPGPMAALLMRVAGGRQLHPVWVWPSRCRWTRWRRRPSSPRTAARAASWPAWVRWPAWPSPSAWA